MHTPGIVVVMGVSGVGKTTIGRLLATALGWPFFEGDDFHPPANVAKMRRGEALTDADRAPWLASLAALIRRLVGEGRSAVLACSALKDAYRAELAVPGVVFVYLKAEPEVIRARLLARGEHFMKAGMLESQLATLEEPREAVTVDAAAPPASLVARIRDALAL